MSKLFIAITALAMVLLAAKPASAENRAELVATVGDQVMMMMAVCGVEPSDRTKADIANRFDDDTFDLDHAKVLVLGAMAASSRAADEGGMQGACKKWHEVFVYTGALK